MVTGSPAPADSMKKKPNERFSSQKCIEEIFFSAAFQRNLLGREISEKLKKKDVLFSLSAALGVIRPRTLRADFTRMSEIRSLGRAKYVTTKNREKDLFGV
jgi:hypothetical protein